MARDDAKPIRSLLYTPGDQEQRLADNAASGADALFLDLEEPRTPCTEETRVRARELVREFLDTAPTGPGAPRYFVRVQPVASAACTSAGPVIFGSSTPVSRSHRTASRSRRIIADATGCTRTK